MTHFLYLNAKQRPFPYAVDANRRTLFSVNFGALAAGPSGNDYPAEIGRHLAALGLATLNVDTFIGPNSRIPDGDGPFAELIDTGGGDSDQTHGSDAEYERLSLQVIVRAANYAVGSARALAIWRALDNQYNVTFT